ncbi:hypothetical protein AVEN_185667-1 [Araneus ventricosus]|uniref:Uncharacterized protein n=1 Tax=Araneus ventricosus TaxID=182803 RepID=A0A4Y2FV99_ARAVE|nr:hypothetical protein AVEN_185667-1 [Araneus ventricosus]
MKIRRVWGVLHVKSYVMTKRPPVGVEWKFEEGVIEADSHLISLLTMDSPPGPGARCPVIKKKKPFDKPPDNGLASGTRGEVSRNQEEEAI